MKKAKTLTLLTAIFIIIFCISAYGAENVFETPAIIGANDYAQVMQPSTIEYINESNDALMSQYKSKIILVTVPTTGIDTIDTYTTKLYKAWSVSYIGDGSSVMVVMATDDMQYWTVVGNHLQSALTPDIVNSILLQYMEPDFEKRNFDAAVRKTYDAFRQWYNSTYNSAYKDETQQNDIAGNTTKDNSKLPGIIWSVFKITFFALIIILVFYVYLRRKIRLRRLAKRRRIRRATIEKYRNEPKEQYSFSYSYMSDDDEWDK